jgi:hypothetical protein
MSSLKVAGGKGGSTGLALSAPDGAMMDKPFTVTAYVYNARRGQSVTLMLPDGMELAPGEQGTKQVLEAGPRQPVTFKVIGRELSKDGKKFKIEAKTGTTTAPPVEVLVLERSIFG